MSQAVFHLLHSHPPLFTPEVAHMLSLRCPPHVSYNERNKQSTELCPGGRELRHPSALPALRGYLVEGRKQRDITRPHIMFSELSVLRGSKSPQPADNFLMLSTLPITSLVVFHQWSSVMSLALPEIARPPTTMPVANFSVGPHQTFSFSTTTSHVCLLPRHCSLVLQDSLSYDCSLCLSPQNSLASIHTWWQTPLPVGRSWDWNTPLTVCSVFCYHSDPKALWLTLTRKGGATNQQVHHCSSPHCLNFPAYPHQTYSLPMTTSHGSLPPRHYGQVFQVSCAVIICCFLLPRILGYTRGRVATYCRPPCPADRNS
jgi:hypothetical protein